MAIIHPFPLLFERRTMSHFESPRDYWLAPGGPLHSERENRTGPDWTRAHAAGARAAGGALHPFEGLGKFELMAAWEFANSLVQSAPDPHVRFSVHIQRRRVR